MSASGKSAQEPENGTGPARGGTESGPAELVFAEQEGSERLRRPSDLGQLLVAAVGLLLTLGLALYLPRTVAALSEDLHHLLLRSGPLLSLPLNALASVAVLIPLVVLIELLVRRTLHHLWAGLLAALAAVAISFGVRVLLENSAPANLLDLLSVTAPSGLESPVLSHAVALVALLTALGPRRNLTTLNLGWAALLGALVLSVLGNRLALAAALLTFFTGRLTGLGVRMLRGSRRRRGAGLAAALRAAGLSPVSIRRVQPDDVGPRQPRDGGPRQPYDVGPRQPEDGGPRQPDDGGPRQPYAWQSARSYGLRLYEVDTADGRALDLAVLDEDSRIRGSLIEFWRAVRIREAMRRQTRISLRQTAEKDALVLAIARGAGVRAPRLVTIAEAGLTSVLMVTERTPSMRGLDTYDGAAVTDTQLDDIWNQLRRLHAGNVAHRSLSRSTVCLTGDGEAWLRGLQEGEAAASPLAKRLDIAQLLTALATVVGAGRAVESARRNMGVDALIQALPLLQALVIPTSTRRALRQCPEVLPAVRAGIAGLVPEAETEPVQVSRFSTRRLITVVAGTLAAYLLAVQVADIDFGGLLEQANPWWAGAALVLSLTTYLGTAMSLHGVAPVKLRYWRSVLVQIGASLTALITPAGVGAPALNARYLQQAGVRTHIAVTSMGLLQLSMLAVMGLVVLVLAIVSGFNGGISGSGSAGSGTAGEQASSELVPVSVAVAVVLGIVALAALSLLIPPVRRFASRQWQATVTGTLPRMVDVVTQPRRLALTLGGILVSNGGYILTFAASLAAFGISVDAVQLVIVYLIGNLFGSVVPTPGGLGAVESSLVLGLTATGVGAAAALSAVLLFRLISFWLRVPFGWLAIRFLTQRQQL